jgi:hypothetical protein
LQLVVDETKKRIATLQTRVDTCRQNAIQCCKQGKRNEALRELKRAKVAEGNIEAAVNTLDALDMQRDMLEQTTLQKQVAAALGESKRSLKHSGRVLSQTEEAIETFIELGDRNMDIHNAFSELVASTPSCVDHDALKAELDDMVAGQSKTVDTANDSAVEAIAATIENKYNSRALPHHNKKSDESSKLLKGVMSSSHSSYC